MSRWAALLFCTIAAAQSVPEIRWEFGPSVVAVGPGASLHVPKGMIHVAGAEMGRFLEFTGNPPCGNEIAVAGPVTLDWFAVFSWRTYAALEFEAANPDPVEIARSIRAGSEAANRERTRQGRETLELLEWSGEPVFDEQTGKLEFRLRTQESGGRQVENRFVYLLGRKGVLEVELVSEADREAADFDRLLDGIEWKAGEGYQKRRGAAPLAVAGFAAVAAAALWIRFWRQRGQ